MKNKIKLIDINIVSAYMGRFLTIIVTVAVLVITVSALLSRGGIRNHTTLLMEVPASGDGISALEFFEPMRYLLARETGRSVEVRERVSDPDQRCELFIMPIGEYLSGPGNQELVPLYSVYRTERGTDAAVLVVRRGEGVPAVTSPDDIVFSGPASINGCWVQMEMLEAAGTGALAWLDSLRFASPPGGTRVVFSVLMAEYTLGACRLSDITELVETGAIGKDEVEVADSSPAAPELVIVCRSADAGYYRGVLKHVAARIAAPGKLDREYDAVELLKSRGMRSLRPVTDEQLGRAAGLYVRIGKRM